MIKPILLIALTCLLSCGHDNNPQPDSEGYACGNVITYRIDLTSVPIYYAKEINEYYIQLDPDTVMNRQIGVFCNLPDSYKGAGKVISFNGAFAKISARDSTNTDFQFFKFFKSSSVYRLSIKKFN